ncbi:hypothetical protein CBP51_04375 [Cellvibrio mixtus]|uniref:DUF3300 domain-containing protein n=1 Tax=Cellvibrio mixtus TaxID=39650 RepID=A0A266QAA2_9GAMM|nr:DUF3300 domain-containing protein [Cellvibrio mixtus]OZY86269.1 hypothetical protein CBP51_04375 [Cellvibrio mixtus]
MTYQLLQRPGKLALTLSLLLPLLVGCTTSQAVETPAYRGAATQSSFSSAQLDSLLAPIALYPDTVLSHVLIASTYPLEVVEADRWARNNTRYKGDDAVNAVDGRDWDPSVKALVAFPDILKRMSDDLDWTQQLGDAFLADEERVMDSIQNLRNRAYDSGNLDKVEHVRVIREERTIVIEPSVERVVYVPAYDTRVVYGNWWWPDYPPVYWHYPSSYVFVSGFYWGPRVYLGPRFYFSAVHWHQRRVVVVDHHHHHRFYDSRSVVRYQNARHWHHNPVHRRGVAYYDNNTRERFNSPRESYRDTREYRSNLRDGNQIAPNRARDQRQGRDAQFQQQLERRQAGPMGGNDARARIYGNDEQRNQPRADQLRERMTERREQLNVPSNRQGDDQRARNLQPERQERLIERRESRPETSINRTQQPEYRAQPGVQSTQERQRIYRTEQPNRQQDINSNRVERIQSPRAQPAERSQPRFQNNERRDTPRVERSGGDNRASMRGERER